MKNISKILVAIVVLLSITSSFAQIKNVKTEKVKIAGNCDMCKSRIEKAGNEKNISKVVWNDNNQMATITFNANKTSKKEILTRIANAGHDSEMFQTSAETYNDLPECCQYKRVANSDMKPSFSCTKHPNEISSEKGKCSKCNMELIETKVYSHDSSLKTNQAKPEIVTKYVCTMCKTSAEKSGKCPKCGMEMVMEETKK